MFGSIILHFSIIDPNDAVRPPMPFSFRRVCLGNIGEVVQPIALHLVDEADTILIQPVLS